MAPFAVLFLDRLASMVASGLKASPGEVRLHNHHSFPGSEIPLHTYGMKLSFPADHFLSSS